MLKIFDKNHNAIGHIVKYKDCKIESELSTGDKTLYFTYLAKHHSLTNEMYVRAKDDEYVIKEVPVATDSFPQIVAVLNLEDLQKDMWRTFSVTDVTIDEAARTVLAGTGWTIGECNVTKRRNAGMMQVSSLEVIQNLCKAFMCEPVFDTINKKVSFYVQRGEDKGVYFMSGLNLKKLQKKSTSYDYYTRIIPIGANGLTIESVNDGKNYLENYQYSNKALTYIWKDESYTDAQALKDDAELKLNDLSKPTLSYSADVRDLAKQKTEYAILSYSLGDNVTLIDSETGTRDKQRIVKLVEYPQNPEKNTCELANTVLTFEEMQKKVQDAANIINYTIAGDGRYTGTINVSDILHFEQGVAGSTTISGINSSISSMQGDLAHVKITVGEIDANYIKADEAELKYATIENLNVTNETVHSIQGDYASFKSTVTDEFAATTADITNLTGRFSTFEQTVTDELITAKGWMAEGSIGSAQISSVDANKIKSGTIDTAIVTISGSDGRLQISDNTMQISDANRVRVQVGKDASGDYTLAVWDSSGKLIWDALGATENTIQRKIIRDKMVADDAAIQALKLDLQSFNTALTNQGVTISGTVVQVGDKTLNVALTEQSQAISEHGETLTDHATKIAANEKGISLKVSTQEYESYKNTVNGEITSAKNRLSTAESSITALNGQIALKVEQTDIDAAVKKVDDKFANYSTTTQMNTAINQKADSITQSVSATYATKSSLETANSNITSLTSRMQTAESKLTKDGLTTIVGDYYTTAAVVDNKIDGIQVGGRNLISDTQNFGVMNTTGFYLSSVGASKNGESYDQCTVRYYSGTLNDVNATKEIVGYGTLTPEYGQSYTFSFWAKGSGKFRTYFYGGSGYVQVAKTVASDGDSNVGGDGGKTWRLTEEWKRYWITYTLATTGNIAAGKYLLIRHDGYYETNLTISIAGLKLEKGNKATDWSPAPEDVDSSISAVNTIATQTADKFNWLVKSGTSSTDFTLTDRTATLVANAINLQGLVTFDGLSSSAKSSIVDSVQIGGRNLLKNSHKTAVEYAYPSSGFMDGYNWESSIPLNSDTYTLSFWAKSTVNGDKIRTHFYNPSNITSIKGSQGQSSTAGDGQCDFTLTTTLTKYWVTYTIPKGGNSTRWVIVPRLFPGSGSGTITVQWEKLEEGNKATDWSPAPEDVDSSISAVDTALANLCYDSNKTYINGGKIYTGTIAAAQIASNAITTDKLAANSVTAAKIATDAIKSKNYAYSSGNYSTAGTFLDLSNGLIRSKNFAIDSSGNAYLKGTITATSGKIGKYDITSTYLMTGSGSTATGIGGNQAFWAGSESSNSAPFRVAYDGTLVATNATISGNITATSGSFTGTVNANSGKIGDISISGNKISYDSIDSSYGTLAKFEISKSQLSYGCMVVKGNSIQIGRDQRDQAFTDGNDATRIYGDFLFQDYSNTMRRPVASVTGDGSRVGYMGSSVSTGVKIAGQWNVVGASLSVKTFTASSSDIRLKENIRPTEVEALPLINQIGIYQFDWKRDGRHQKIGVIADYLEAQDKSLAIGGGYDDDGMMDEKVVDNFYLTVYAIKGIQELSSITTRAEERITDVETIARSTQSEMDSLKSQVSSLQYQLEQAYTRIATLEKQLQAAG